MPSKILLAKVFLILKYVGILGLLSALTPLWSNLFVDGRIIDIVPTTQWITVIIQVFLWVFVCSGCYYWQYTLCPVKNDFILLKMKE